MYHAKHHLIIYKQCSSFMALTKWNDYTCLLFYSPNKMETLNQKNKMETLYIYILKKHYYYGQSLTINLIVAYGYIFS